MSFRFLAVVALASLPFRSMAEEADGFCRHLQGVAESEAALLRSPEAFGSVGYFSAVGSETEPSAGRQTTRILTGLRYDFIHLVRGNLHLRRAEAECRRYRALVSLEEALRSGGGAAARPALHAKLAVLRRTLPAFEERIRTLEGEVRNANATVEDLQALRIRVDGLRAMATDAEVQLGRLQGEAPKEEGPPAPLPELLEAWWSADGEVEQAEEDLRNARAFGVEVKGGYEELLGIRQGVPLFGVVTLSYNLGNLWQRKANEKSREGRSEWRRERSGVAGSERISEAVRGLAALREAQRKRVEEVTILADDLRDQLAEVDRLETRKVNRYRDFLWLESARLEAERAYLETHLRELDRFLGPTVSADAHGP